MPSVFHVLAVDLFSWVADWAWGLPLIVLTVVIHVVGISLASRSIRLFSEAIEQRHPKTVFTIATCGTTLIATCMHGIEAGIWAFAYQLLGALPNFKLSMLYSLNAMTSYGHENFELDGHWRLLGALESVNGWLLFGLTTAFLFAVIEKCWLFNRGQLRR